MAIIPLHNRVSNPDKLYKSLFEESLEAFYITSRDGTILDINLACQRLFGFEKEEFLGVNVTSLYVDEAEREFFQKEIETKASVEQFKVKLKRKDGETIVCYLSSSVHYDESGQPNGYHGIIRDAMDMKAVVDALMETEKKYRSLFQDSKDAIFYSTIDGDFIDVNVTASAILGYTAEEFMELNLHEIFKYPSEVTLYRAELAEKEFIKDYPAKLIRKNGSEVDTLITVTLKHSEHRQIIGVQGIIRDVTTQKRAQEREHLLLRAMETTSEGILMLNNSPNNPIVYSNPSFAVITEYDLASTIGEPLSFLFGKKTQKKSIKAIAKAIAEATYYEDELELSTAKDKYFWANITLSPVFNDAGDAIHFICRLQDITDRKKQQAEILEMTKKRLEMKMEQQKIRASAVIEGQEEERQRVARELHDGLGQLLTAANLNVQNLNEVEGEEKIQIISEIKKLLTETIVETKRISQDLMPNVLKDFGLVAALEKLCEQQNRSCESPIIFQHFGDIDRLDQHIERGVYRTAQEALNNAAKYAAANEISVQLLLQGDALVMMIEDDGIGFDRKKASKKKLTDNGGNGLTNMEERIDLLGGQFNIESSPKRGTLVTISVPLK